MQQSQGKQTAAAAGAGLIGQLGGAIPFALFTFWLLIAFAGWVVALAGLSAAQKSVNGGYGPDQWAINANYPLLSSGQAFRLDWFILFYDLVTLILISITVLTLVLVPARVSVVGFLAVATVLSIISADRFYNLSHVVTGALRKRARTTFAGFLIKATAEFGLLYHLGLQPEAL